MISKSNDTTRCPICRREFRFSETSTPPFCSPRCQQIDLARWLGESYAFPAERSDEDDESIPQVDDLD